LDSILAQEYTDWTCIIVDDGSADGTLGVAREYSVVDTRFQTIHIEHEGLCGARNRGLAMLPSGTELVTIMDSDDVWVPRALGILVAEVQRRSDVIGAHALGDFIDEKGLPLRPGEFAALGRQRQSGRRGRLSPWPLSAPTCFETVVTRSTIFPPGLLLMRRWVYQAIGGYDPWSIEGDWDLLIRATRHGDLAFVNEVVLGYRRHSTNLGARCDMGDIMHRVFSRAYYSSDNSQEHAAILRGCWKARQAAVMKDRFDSARFYIQRRQPRRCCREIARGTVSLGRYLRRGPRPLRATGERLILGI
jgi:glycosyltransferase involved in cell wall biosynthesis